MYVDERDKVQIFKLACQIYWLDYKIWLIALGIEPLFELFFFDYKGSCRRRLIQRKKRVAKARPAGNAQESEFI